VVLKLCLEVVAPIAWSAYLTSVSVTGNWRRLWIHSLVLAGMLAGLTRMSPRITYDNLTWMGPAVTFYPIGIIAAAVAITMTTRFGASRWIRVSLGALAAHVFGFGVRWYA
jgi:hypothetical protein